MSREPRTIVDLRTEVAQYTAEVARLTKIEAAYRDTSVDQVATLAMLNEAIQVLADAQLLLSAMYVDVTVNKLEYAGVAPHTTFLMNMSGTITAGTPLDGWAMEDAAGTDLVLLSVVIAPPGQLDFTTTGNVAAGDFVVATYDPASGDTLRDGKELPALRVTWPIAP